MLLKNALLNSMAAVWQIGLSLVTVRYMVRSLGEQDYGLFILLTTLMTLFEFGTFGLGEATVRYVAHYHGERDVAGVARTFGATLTVYCISGTAISVVLFLAAPLVVGLFAVSPSQLTTAVSALQIIAPGCVLATVSGAYLSMPTALQRYDIVSGTQILLSTFSSVGFVTVLWLDGGIVGLAGVTTARMATALVLGLFVASHLMPDISLIPRPSRQGLREVFGYGIFSFLNQMIAWAANHIDRLVLGSLASLQDVSWLGVPRQMLDHAGRTVSSMSDVLFPRFSASRNQEDDRRLYWAASWSLSALSVLVFVPTTVFMPDLLRLWITPAFADASAPVAQLIAACMATRGSFAPYFEYLKGTGRIRHLSVCFLSTTLVGVVLAVPLLLHFGILGAGYRMWLLSWAGMLISCWVWVSLLGGRARVLLSAVGETWILGLGVGLLAGYCRTLLSPLGWFGVILAWILVAATLALCLLAVNRLRFGVSSPGSRVLQLILQIRARVENAPS